MNQQSAEVLRSATSKELDEWFGILVRENGERIKTAAALSIPKGQFSFGSFVEVIFSICQEYALPKEAWYLAAEVFESFMQSHLVEMYQYVKEHAATARSEWRKVMVRISNQAPLRLLSCCQIASKFVSSYEHLSHRNIVSQLRKLGHKFNEEAITKSEARVLRTLGHRVHHSTPLVYLDLLLAKLCNQPEFMAKYEEHRIICLDLFDVLMVDKQDIYQLFAEVISSSQANSQSERCAIFAIGKDYMFMAASVIAAASFIVDQDFSDWVVETLAHMTKVDSSDIVDMSSVLLRPLAKDGTNSFC